MYHTHTRAADRVTAATATEIWWRRSQYQQTVQQTVTNIHGLLPLLWLRSADAKVVAVATADHNGCVPWRVLLESAIRHTTVMICNCCNSWYTKTILLQRQQVVAYIVIVGLQKGHRFYVIGFVVVLKALQIHKDNLKKCRCRIIAVLCYAVWRCVWSNVDRKFSASREYS